MDIDENPRQVDESTRAIIARAGALRSEVEEQAKKLRVQMQDWQGHAREVAQGELDKITRSLDALAAACRRTGETAAESTAGIVAADKRAAVSFGG